MLFAEFILFIVAVFAVFYLPGKWLIDKFAYKAKGILTDVTLSLAVGIACFLTGTYLLAWINASFVYLVLLLPILYIQIPKTITSLRHQYISRQLISFESLIIFIGIVAMVSITVGSGMEKDGTLVFYGFNGQDGIFHSALIGNLMFQFPPSFPGLSHTMLRGYHILYDFMLSRFAVFFRFSSFDLYFRFFSIFTAFFYGLAGISLAYALDMKVFVRRIFIFLLFFAQGAEFFLFHWFQNGDLLYNSGVVQPLGNIVDPSVLFSISMVFVLYIVLFSMSKKRHMIFPILILGIIPGIKIYTGILAYISFGVVSLYEILNRKFWSLYVIAFASLLSGVFYLPFNIGAGFLIFAPFLLFRHFMESNQLFSAFQWILKLQVYEMHHNSLRIIYLYVIALLLFFIPSLGIRLFSFIKIKALFSKKFYTQKNIFWFVFIAVGLLIPAFFIQSVGVFNIVQFYWLVWIALLIPTAFSFQSLIRPKQMFGNALVIAMVVLLSLPAMGMPLRYLSHNSPFVVSGDLIKTIRDMQQVVSSRDDIMVVNREFKVSDFVDTYSIPLIAALAKRPVYYEAEAADFSQSQHIETARKAVINQVSLMLSHCSADSDSTIVKVMHTVNVSYLFLIDGNGCVGELSSLQKVIQNGKYSIYKLIQ